MNWFWKNVWWFARVLLALHAAFAVIAWFNLPSRIPTHFDLRGHPDAWSSRSVFGWFALIFVSFGIQCLIQVLMSSSGYESWNIPEKERFLKLTKEQQAPVIELIRGFGGFSALCVAITFIGLQTGMYLTAQGYAKGFPWYIHLTLFVPVVCLLIVLIPWAGAVEKRILSASSQEEHREFS